MIFAEIYIQWEICSDVHVLNSLLLLGSPSIVNFTLLFLPPLYPRIWASFYSFCVFFVLSTKGILELLYIDYVSEVSLGVRAKVL